ncbi:hypothetical protein ACIPC1_12950 [Streptomyces sp. NPDC087263]|uniref:hypothetical protein n=1 Tax=Streptomyces sp. NPDC087263 TaxID=3365773 RepID=UPI0038146D75
MPSRARVHSVKATCATRVGSAQWGRASRTRSANGERRHCGAQFIEPGAQIEEAPAVEAGADLVRVAESLALVVAQ